MAICTVIRKVRAKIAKMTSLLPPLWVEIHLALVICLRVTVLESKRMYS